MNLSNQIYILVFIFISCCFQTNAQVVDIPDIFIQEFLTTEGVDENNDGLFQQEEVDKVFFLNLNSIPFRSLEGLQHFRNLEELNIANNVHIDSIDFVEYEALEELVLSNLDSLKVLQVSGHDSLEDLILGRMISMKSISLDDISTLKNLNLNNDSLEIFEFGNLENLESLELRIGPNVNSVDLSSLTSLEFLQLLSSQAELIDINYGVLPNLIEIFYSLKTADPLDFQRFPNLKIINYADGFLNLDSIIIENHENIERVSVRTFSVENIRLKNLPALEFFNTASTSALEILELESLDNFTETEIINTPRLREASFKNIPKLETLRIREGSELESIIIEDMPNLDRLSFEAERAKTIDLTSLTGLENLTLETPSLEYLYIKNNTDEELECIECDDLIYICADESDTFEEIPDEVFIGSFCPNTSEGARFEITGNINYDFGENNCASNTLPIPYVNLKLDKDGIDVGGVSSNAVGLYGIFLDNDSLILSPAENSFNSLFEFNPSSISIDTSRRTTTQNICVQPKEQVCEFELFITSTSAPRPGEITDYKLFVRNIGTLIPEGTISLLFQEDLIKLEEASIDPDGSTEGVLTWELPALLPFEKYEIDVAFELNRPTDAMPLNDGDTLRFDLVVDASSDNEQKVFTNSLTELIVNSFDPNDKTCLQGPEIEQKDLDEFLFYRIRFENIGSAEALNVVVEDTIDASVFELNTFQVVDASHEMKTNIRGSNVAFIFEKINLGFEDDVNDGFVVFKIKPKSGLDVGQNLENKASIFFDFNFPINTNVARTTIVEDFILSLGSAQSVEKLHLFPSISDSYISFDGIYATDKILIFNLQGVKFYDFEIHSGNTIQISNLEKGIYFVQIQREDVRYIGRFIKM